MANQTIRNRIERLETQARWYMSIEVSETEKAVRKILAEDQRFVEAINSLPRNGFGRIDVLASLSLEARIPLAEIALALSRAFDRITVSVYSNGNRSL
jgi:hypothetical protein